MAASRRRGVAQHAAADLVELDALEQRAEVAFAEALVAAALDDLEEDRADHRLREDLQQEPAALGRRAGDQDTGGRQAGQALARADRRLREDLQREPAALGRRAVDKDTVGSQALQVIAMARQAGVDLLII